MSGALLSTLFGLALSNLGVIPSEAPHVYGVVNAYLLPLAVPLLLFSADLRCGSAGGFPAACRAGQPGSCTLPLRSGAHMLPGRSAARG